MSTLGERLWTRMHQAGIRDLVHVANGEGFGLYNAFKQGDDTQVIDACREGEAVAICCGLYLGGRFPVLSMENFGIYESLDTMRAFPIALRIPMIIIVGYTFRAAYKSEDGGATMERLQNLAPHAMIAAEWTEPMLDLAKIPYWYMAPDNDGAAFEEAYATAVERQSPTAILVDVTA